MDNEERISNMDALLFALVLEVALLQMRIQEGSTELRSRYWQCSHKREKAQRNKLVADRGLVRDVIRKSLVEMAEQGGYEALRRALLGLEQRARAAVALRLTHERLRQTREAVSEDLQLKRDHWTQELCRADNIVAFLRDKLKDDLLNASTRLRYADRWLRARGEALELRCQWAGAPVPRADHEARVHAELVKAFELQIKEREEALDYWRIRYSDNTANINERLANVRDMYMEAISQREKLQALYDLHEGEMRGWLTFKRERAARQAREQRLCAAATRAQAWWRGVMVRKALGQYKFLRNIKKQPTKAKKK